MQNTNNIVTSTRYNKDIQHTVYYAKSNTCCDYDVLLCEVLHKYNFTEWQYKIYKSSTHNFAVKVINTDSGVMLHTDSTF